MKTQETEDSTDAYLGLIREHWPGIVALYRSMTHERAVMLFDIQAQRIAAFALKDFQKDLSRKSQMMLIKQYNEAGASNQMLVFVEDHERRRLVSLSLDLDFDDARPNLAVKAKVAPRSFTARQGQYLAFIHYYTRVNGRPPAETDIARYFKVTAVAAHGMLGTLERLGLIAKTPWQARSIEVLVPRESLPELG